MTPVGFDDVDLAFPLFAMKMALGFTMLGFQITQTILGSAVGIEPSRV